MRSRSGICDASRRNLKRAGRFTSRDGGVLLVADDRMFLYNIGAEHPYHLYFEF